MAWMAAGKLHLTSEYSCWAGVERACTILSRLGHAWGADQFDAAVTEQLPVGEMLLLLVGRAETDGAFS